MSGTVEISKEEYDVLLSKSEDLTDLLERYRELKRRDVILEVMVPQLKKDIAELRNKMALLQETNENIIPENQKPI